LLSSFAHEKFVGQSAESWYHSFAQDGRYLVVGGDNGFLQVIETATGNVVAKKRYGSGWLQGDWGYHYNGDGLRDVAIHMENDGSLTIAAAGWGPDSVKIWKLPSKQ
jgi:WD40 repeat protein